MAETKFESVFDIPPDKVAEAAADAEIETGKGVPHERVSAWLLKLAKGEKVLPPST